MLKGQLDRLQVLAHGAVDMNTALNSTMFDAEPESKVGIITAICLLRLRVKICQQRRLISRFVRGIDGDQRIMNSRVSRLQLIDHEQKVTDSLIL